MSQYSTHLEMRLRCMKSKSTFFRLSSKTVFIKQSIHSLATSVTSSYTRQRRWTNERASERASERVDAQRGWFFCSFGADTLGGRI